MYGDNIMVLPTANSNKSDMFHFPAGHWVSIYAGAVSQEEPDRYISQGQTLDSMGHDAFLYEGSLTAMYDTTQSDVKNTDDLLMTKLDLHLVLNT